MGGSTGTGGSTRKGTTIGATGGGFVTSIGLVNGTVFKMTPAGVLTTLVAFDDVTNKGTLPQAGLVQGPPTSRLIIGKREIDIYPDGSMYEKNNFVGFNER